MAVLEVRPIKSEMDGGDNGQRTYTSLYTVTTDARTTAPSTIWVNSSLPQYGDYYTWGSGFDYDAYCISVPKIRLANETATLKKWLVTITHTTLTHNRDSVSPFTSPLSEPWEFDGDADEWTEQTTRDRNGNPIVNSAKEPFRDFQVTRTRDVFTLSRNFASLNLARIQATRNHCNSQSVRIYGNVFPRRTLLCRRISYSRKYYGRGVPYYPHSFTLAYSEDKWDEVRPDYGTREFTGTDAANPKHYTQIQDEATREANGLWPLKDGAVATDGKPGTLRFEVFEESDLNVWGFPG